MGGFHVPLHGIQGRALQSSVDEPSGRLSVVNSQWSTTNSQQSMVSSQSADMGKTMLKVLPCPTELHNVAEP